MRTLRTETGSTYCAAGLCVFPYDLCILPASSPKISEAFISRPPVILGAVGFRIKWPLISKPCTSKRELLPSYEEEQAMAGRLYRLA